MSNCKTIADIIAEKRLIAAEMEKTLGDQHSYVELLKNDADRIEAAWKRESVTAAKLREGLVAIKALTALHEHEFSELGTVYRTAKAFLADESEVSND